MTAKQPSLPEVNPYQAPATICDAVDEQGPGVGVWRDGDLLVMHPQAVHPPFCIESGEPASMRRKFALLWSYPMDWSKRKLYLQLPLSGAANRRRNSRMRTARIAAIVPLVTLFGSLLLFGKQTPGWIVVMLVHAVLVGPDYLAGDSCPGQHSRDVYSCEKWILVAGRIRSPISRAVAPVAALNYIFRKCEFCKNRLHYLGIATLFLVATRSVRTRWTNLAKEHFNRPLKVSLFSLCLRAPLVR
jgi:hypothetical protein